MEVFFGFLLLLELEDNGFILVCWELGKWFFYDLVMLVDFFISCVFCYDLVLVFVDGCVVSFGVENCMGRCNVFSLVNVVYYFYFICEGGVFILEM